MLKISATSQITDWLRSHVRSPPPGKIARWLGAETDFSYELLGEPQLINTEFIEQSVLFTLSASDPGLLPFAVMPVGSWGVFAFDGHGLSILYPDDDSCERLLRLEKRSLTEADPKSLAQLLCLVRLKQAKGCVHHVVIECAEALRTFAWTGFEGYQVSESELQIVQDTIIPPLITDLPGSGWELSFTTIHGWMHQLNELGIEVIHVTPEFTFRRQPRQVLSKRIFQAIPSIRY